MLDGYGFHSIIWNDMDDRFGEVLVASLADAAGRGIALEVREDGSPADLDWLLRDETYTVPKRWTRFRAQVDSIPGKKDSMA